MQHEFELQLHLLPAIQFVLSDEFSHMRKEKRQTLLHVSIVITLLNVYTICVLNKSTYVLQKDWLKLVDILIIMICFQILFQIFCISHTPAYLFYRKEVVHR